MERGAARERGVASAKTDGACVGNPGPMGIGGELSDADGHVVATFSESVGVGTNNEAEYLAVVKVLELAKGAGLGSLVVMSDSQLVVNQINGDYSINHTHLARLHGRVMSLARAIPGGVTFRWISRTQNTVADALASKAAGMPQAVVRDNAVVRWHSHGFTPDPQEVNKLPETKPAGRDGIQELLSKGSSAKFRDFMLVKTGGIDSYSRAKVEVLENIVAVRFGPEAVEWLRSTVETFDTDYGKSALKWTARGLPPDMALKKVSVDLEARANASFSRSDPGIRH